MRGRVPGPIALVVTALYAACSPSGEAGSRAETWSVSTQPAVSIGEMDGDTTVLFQRITDLAFTPQGEIVVADGGLGVLRVFDREGRFVTQIGRRGEGPGEFESIRGIWTFPPDSMGVWDSGAYRLTYFRTDGSLARTVTLEAAARAAGVGSLDQFVGPLADGSVALASITIGDGPPPRSDRMSVEVFSAEGRYAHRLAEIQGMVRGTRAPIPFSPFPYFAVRDGAVLFTRGVAPEVRALGGGDTTTLVFPPAEVDVDSAWESLRPALEAREQPFFLGLLDEMEKPGALPHIAGLLVDDEGNVWTKTYRAPGDALWLDGGARVRGGSWMVATREGRLVATVDLPEGFSPFEVAADRILGLSIDVLGVERVEVYGLNR